MVGLDFGGDLMAEFLLVFEGEKGMFEWRRRGLNAATWSRENLVHYISIFLITLRFFLLDFSFSSFGSYPCVQVGV